jgi:Uma2 family endonuclease
MADPASRRLTYAEYLAVEHAAGQRHEYVAGTVRAMAGGSPEHGRLTARMTYLLSRALEGRPCNVFSSDVRIRIRAADRATYPDLSIVWGSPTRLASLREYVLVSQREQRIDVYRRDGRRWTIDEHASGERARLTSIDVEIEVDELYRAPAAS